jgi:hypothetical protein
MKISSVLEKARRSFTLRNSSIWVLLPCILSSGCGLFYTAFGNAVIKSREKEYLAAMNRGESRISFIAPTTEKFTIRKLALWPSPPYSVSLLIVPDLADKLGKIEVVSPATVGQILKSNLTSMAIAEMTTQEKFQAFKVVCDQTGADAVLVVNPINQQQSASYQNELNCMRYTTTPELFFAAKHSSILLTGVLDVKINSNVTSPEVQQMFTAALARQILDLTTKSEETVAEHKK